MKHDELCEMKSQETWWGAGCHCGSRAYKRAPITDTPYQEEAPPQFTWFE